MESHENYNNILSHVMELFTRGKKLSNSTVHLDLLDKYKRKLEQKDEVHQMIMEIYRKDNE